MVIIQPITLTEKLINTKWKANLNGININDGILVILNINDDKLIKYVTKHQTRDCLIQKEENSHSVSLYFTVKKINHVINTIDNSSESVIMVIPSNKLIEQILIHLIDEKLYDAKFNATINKSITEPQAV